MPNLRGPAECKRRLYANVLASIALYGAPIWSDSLEVSQSGKRIYRRFQRTVALRVCSAYRTVSFDAATLMARMPPWDLVAAERKRTFNRIKDARALGPVEPSDIKRIHMEERAVLAHEWLGRLQDPNVSGRRTADAITPIFQEWMNRRWGGVSFHLTQIVTGHGCFGSYLHRIGRQPVGPKC